MFDGDRIQYLTQAGVIFLVYLFVMIVLFFALSPIVDGFFGNFGSLEVGDATDEIQTYSPVYHFACRMILAMGIAIPIVWFIFWCLSHDPTTRRRRYF